MRVPTEVIKQRMQTKQFATTSDAVRNVLRTEGILGFYRGFLSTVAREIPFTCIQFPVYEYFKYAYSLHKGRRIEPYEAAVWGSLAGGLAAAITTPLDVCKTRIMLLQKVKKIAIGWQANKQDIDDAFRRTKWQITAPELYQHSNASLRKRDLGCYSQASVHA